MSVKITKTNVFMYVFSVYKQIFNYTGDIISNIEYELNMDKISPSQTDYS